MRLYCKENAHVNVLGLRSISVSPVSGFMVTFLLRVGKFGPMTPVMANGRRYFTDSGKSPNPLPKKIAGETLEKESATW
jgi:hypothetical protein